MPGDFTCSKVAASVSRGISPPVATNKEPAVLPPLVRGRETPDKTLFLLIARDLHLTRVGYTLRDPILHGGRLKVISTAMARLPQNVEMTDFTWRRGPTTHRFPHHA